MQVWMVPHLHMVSLRNSLLKILLCKGGLFLTLGRFIYSGTSGTLRRENLPNMTQMSKNIPTGYFTFPTILYILAVLGEQATCPPMVKTSADNHHPLHSQSLVRMVYWCFATLKLSKPLMLLRTEIM